MILAKFALVILLSAVVALVVWRLSDAIRANSAWKNLAELSIPSPAAFDPAMIVELPEPAQRYFACSISPGTPLGRVDELTMEGD